MNTERNRVCPVALAGALDTKIRKWIQNPQKILSTYVHAGMIVLDIGCGPGFFSIELAKMVGENGKVIAADLQEGMLQKLSEKIKGSELEERIVIHKCERDKIGIVEKVDFALAFYMVHEAPDQDIFFDELKSILKENGRMLIVEPRLFHVSKKDFELTVRKAAQKGFQVGQGIKLLFSWSAMLTNV